MFNFVNFVNYCTLASINDKFKNPMSPLGSYRAFEHFQAVRCLFYHFGWNLYALENSVGQNSLSLCRSSHALDEVGEIEIATYLNHRLLEEKLDFEKCPAEADHFTEAWINDQAAFRAFCDYSSLTSYDIKIKAVYNFEKSPRLVAVVAISANDLLKFSDCEKYELKPEYRKY
jgi:hypothetical protein